MYNLDDIIDNFWVGWVPVVMFGYSNIIIITNLSDAFTSQWVENSEGTNSKYNNNSL